MPDDRPGLTAAKASLRRQMRAGRAARTPGHRQEAAVGLAARVLELIPPEPGRIACYLSLAAEPGTAELIEDLQSRGHRVWVPRIEGAALAWVELRRGTSLGTGPLGIAEPVGAADGDLAGMTVILLPATAVDRRGNRLGQGGGFYDRALATVPTAGDGGPMRVALVFDEEVVDTVPADARDQRVDVIVTPLRTLRVG